MEATAKGFACLLLETKTYYIIIAGPTSNTSPGHNIFPLLVLLNHLTIEVSAEAYRGIGELSFNPVLLI
jgi:hypothetical protein